MSFCGIILIAVLISFPFAWLVLEFKNARPVMRRIVGISAIISSFVVALLLSQIFLRLNYNVCYSSSCHRLLSSIIENLEAKRSDAVINNLEQLRKKLPVNCYVRGNFDELADQAVKDMNSQTSPPK